MVDRNEGHDGIDLVASMGWIPLPFGCVGLVRPRDLGGGRTVWSWLVVVPWAVNDAKPWIDGTELLERPLASEDEQRAEVLAKLRAILDERYGESVAGRAADEFLRSLEED